ncbi:hypothetical protein RCH23_003256 [Cryobacterium sp. CAN_C3]|nr:hypothetical protein [Cryobacterium sp. CAN_C3]
MKKWKGGLAAFAVAAMLLSGISSANAVEAPVTAPLSVSFATTGSGASPTGQYDWMCVLTSGYTYFLPNGEPLSNCKGSYLKRYLNGQQVQSYRLAYGGGAVNYKAEGCLIAVIGGILAVMSPTMTMRFVFGAAVGGGAVYYSCRA